ncbi:unnamed protein product [Phaeothamnion confervicola]
MVRVRGGGDLKLPVAVEAMEPDISLRLHAPRLNFGDLAAGGEATAFLELRNGGDVEGSLFLDLSAQPEFHVLEALAPAPVAAAATVATAAAAETPRKWHLTVAPGGCLAFRLAYRATTVASHTFNLRLALEGTTVASGGGGYGGANAARSKLTVAVLARGLKPAIVFSTLALEFGDRVVSRDPSQLRPYSGEVTARNDSAAPIIWALDDAAGPPAFYVAPTRGELAPGEEVKIRVTFTPRRDNDYAFALPVLVGGPGLRGSGVYPRLTFDCEEIRLPPVPLGIPTRARFLVVNGGYADVEVRF